MAKGKTVDILNIPINTELKHEVLDLVGKCLQQNTNNLIATVNASFILKSTQNKNFKNILVNKTLINTADGVSVQMAADYLNMCQSFTGFSILKHFVFLTYGLKVGSQAPFFSSSYNVIPHKITGVYLVKQILKLLDKNGGSVVIFQRADSHTLEHQITNYINKNFKNVKVIVEHIDIQNYKNTLSKTYTADVALCTLGEVKQESFLIQNSKQIKSKVSIGVGGAFDVLTGKVSISSVKSDKGLEWFYRLASNPKRFFKIMRSVILFPIKVYFHSLTL
jgi:N-acetylglucosaminyldiphosphoundecaprenol N-acetyl-beta-D-mannosaminyltransferase